MQTAELVAGRELDALVAEKVMGWRNVVDDSDPDGESFWVGAPPGQDWLIHIPDYSTDIAVAWQVVERLKPRFDFVLSWEARINAWVAEFWPIDDKGDDPVGGANAETAPLAICRAALAVVGH